MSIAQTVFIGVTATGDILQFPSQAFWSLAREAFITITKYNSEGNELGKYRRFSFREENLVGWEIEEI